MTATLKQFVSVSEAASILDVTRQRVLNLITEGRIQAEKLGTYYAVRIDSVNAYLAEDRKPGRPAKSEAEKKKRTPAKRARKAKTD